MDDDMVKHYSHEDTVLLEVHQIDEETHDITLVEYDCNWNPLESILKPIGTIGTDCKSSTVYGLSKRCQISLNLYPLKQYLFDDLMT